MNRELYGKLVFELSRQGRRGYRLPQSHISSADLTDGKGEKAPQVCSVSSRWRFPNATSLP